MRNLVQLSELEGFEIKDVKQFENRDRDRPEFDNKYLKILYFFAKEGVVSTLRKFFAHKLEQVRYLTLLSIRYEGDQYMNISVQSQKNPSDFVISNEFYPSMELSEDEIDANLEENLVRFNQFNDQVDYSELQFEVDAPLVLRVKQSTFEEQYERGLFIYGLGGYVNMFIMHHFRNVEKIACIDYKAQVSSRFQEKHDFKHSFLVPRSSYHLLSRVKHPIVIIATYHSDHATIAEEVYKSNPEAHILIEKPPTVTLEDLGKLIGLYNKGARLEIGFNRRFIKYSNVVRELVKDKIIIVNCSVKEVVISPNHWYLWENQGTRVTGNVVHWFDLANYWIQSMPMEINVMASPDDIESSAISVLYKNGSVLNITASEKGNSMRGVQEKIEIRFGNESIFIDDFTSIVRYKSNGLRSKRRNLRREKGHSRMYRNFSQIIRGNRELEYPMTDLIHTSVVTYYASKLLKEGKRSAHIGEVIEHYSSGGL